MNLTEAFISVTENLLIVLAFLFVINLLIAMLKEKISRNLRQKKSSNDTTNTSEYDEDEKELSDFATTISEHLNDIVVTADNTIYRKYELLDIDKTIANKQLSWKFDISIDKHVDMNGEKVHIESVPFTSEKNTLFKIDKALNDAELNQIINEVTNYQPEQFITHIYHDFNTDNLSLSNAKRVVIEHCKAPMLNDDEKRQLTETLLKDIKRIEDINDEKRFYELNDKYKNQYERKLSQETLKNLLERNVEIEQEKHMISRNISSHQKSLESKQSLYRNEQTKGNN